MTKRTTAETTRESSSGAGVLRRCIGSKRFGIEAHEAAVEDFPVQPSQKDGLGHMCRQHWTMYTSGLARDAKVRKAAIEGSPADSADAAQPTEAGAAPIAGRQIRRSKVAGPIAIAEGDA
jgi:hypothetical protein